MGLAARRYVVSIMVRLIGHFGVLYNEHPVRTPANTDRLVGLLALNDAALSRRRATELLWPDDPRGRAASHLRTLLYRIHRAAEGLIADDDQLLTVGRHVAIDHADWSGWAGRILTDNWQPADLNRRAPDYGFELLEYLDEDWALIERERFRQRCMHALERQIELLIARTRYVEAIDVGLSGVRLDPFRETMHRSIISCHLSNGNRVEAIRHFELYASLLDRRLGLRPDPSLAELVGV